MIGFKKFEFEKTSENYESGGSVMRFLRFLGGVGFEKIGARGIKNPTKVMLTYQKSRLLTDSNFLKLASTFYEIYLKSRYKPIIWTRFSTPLNETKNNSFDPI